MTDFSKMFDIDIRTSKPDIDMCKCGECGTTFQTCDLETDTDQDGWEMPIYTIHICSVCEDGGCIDDYWPSSEVS